MKIETDGGQFVFLVAKDDAEATLLKPIVIAVNGESDANAACLFDNLENGVEHRILNGVLRLPIG